MSEELSFQEIATEEKIEKCPECGSKKFGRRNDEIYCLKCGLVFNA
jgi:hypothetical protein